LSGSAVTYATGGKGSGTYFAGDGPDGGANTGDGGGALRGDGGSGIVIIKFSDSYTCTVGAGLTSSSSTAGGYTTITFTAGTGTVSFA
jgi:hypothetical protein